MLLIMDKCLELLTIFYHTFTTKKLRVIILSANIAILTVTADCFFHHNSQIHKQLSFRVFLVHGYDSNH